MPRLHGHDKKWHIASFIGIAVEALAVVIVRRALVAGVSLTRG
jgi:hypothetical protein